MASPETTVFIEYCVGCDSHNWCTRHNEQRYATYFTQLKAEIEKENPDV
jgi:hypothetical protein